MRLPTPTSLTPLGVDRRSAFGRNKAGFFRSDGSCIVSTPQGPRRFPTFDSELMAGPKHAIQRMQAVDELLERTSVVARNMESAEGYSGLSVQVDELVDVEQRPT